MNTQTEAKPLITPTPREIRDVIAKLVVEQVATKIIIHKPHDDKTGSAMSDMRSRAVQISTMLDLLHLRCRRAPCHRSQAVYQRIYAKRYGWLFPFQFPEPTAE